VDGSEENLLVFFLHTHTPSPSRSFQNVVKFALTQHWASTPDKHSQDINKPTSITNINASTFTLQHINKSTER
jgi:hypothetical protein